MTLKKHAIKVEEAERDLARQIANDAAKRMHGQSIVVLGEVVAMLGAYYARCVAHEGLREDQIEESCTFFFDQCLDHALAYHEANIFVRAQ